VVLGMLISAALVLLIYKVDDTIKSKEELERLTGAMFITYIEDIGDIKGGSDQ
jgi:capsular polysaccharide biosynthesis protein